MKKKAIVSLIISIVLIFVISTISFADVGSFDRYDSGSSSDWGSSSGSSSDWGSSSWSSSDWGSSSSRWDWDDDYSSGSVSNEQLTPMLLIYVIILILIVGYSMYKSNWKNNHRNKMDLGNIPHYNNNPTVDVGQSHIYADRIKQIDPNFSEEKMLSWAKDLFVKLQNAWTAREWEPMRPFETEQLFEQHNAQIQNYINTNRINIVDRIAVNFATIYKFRQEGDRDILEIALKATMKDYIIDANTKEVLEGNKDQDRITTYKLTFERKTGVLTEEGTENVKTTNCPNCGAPTTITSAGKCPYCGSVITTGANSWVLSGLEPLRN